MKLNERLNDLRARLAAAEADRDAARVEVERLKAELQVEENNCPYPDFSCGTFAAERGIELRPAGGPTYATTVEHWQGLLEQLKLAQAGEARAVEALDVFARAYRVSMLPFAPGIDEADGAYHHMPHGWPSVADFKIANEAMRGPALAWLAQQRAEAAAKELEMLRDHIQDYIGPDDARDEIRRICANRIKDLRAGKEVDNDPHA